jgi:hypothetical protein
MSRVSKLLSFAVLAACLTVVPRAFASFSHEVSSAQSEPQSASDPRSPDGRWALLLMGLFAVWAIATYAHWDENSESSGADESDATAEQSPLAMNHARRNSEWTVAEQKLTRIPPAGETLSGTGENSRVA